MTAGTRRAPKALPSRMTKVQHLSNLLTRWEELSGSQTLPNHTVWRHIESTAGGSGRAGTQKASQQYWLASTKRVQFRVLRQSLKYLCYFLQEMIDEADRDGDGEVNEEEFCRIMKKTSLF